MVPVYANAIILFVTWQGITWAYASETFPLDVRMLCVAITTASTWLGSSVVARSTPFKITDLGYGAYFFFSTVLVLMGLWAFICIPETKRLTLEEMDALFMNPTHKAVWARLKGRPIVPAATAADPDVDDEKEAYEREEVKV
jgi:hypothetical protein